LRLDKLDKELTNIFKSKPTKTQNKGGKQTRTTKQKPIMTKHQQTEAKKFIKETGSAFSGIIKNIKNRKIRKLEKETLNNIERSQALAHKIKTIEANNDALTDIQRYEKELKTLEEQTKQDKAQRKLNQACEDDKTHTKDLSEND